MAVSLRSKTHPPAQLISPGHGRSQPCRLQHGVRRIRCRRSLAHLWRPRDRRLPMPSGTLNLAGVSLFRRLRGEPQHCRSITLAPAWQPDPGGVCHPVTLYARQKVDSDRQEGDREVRPGTRPTQGRRSRRGVTHDRQFRRSRPHR